MTRRSQAPASVGAKRDRSCLVRSPIGVSLGTVVTLTLVLLGIPMTEGDTTRSVPDGVILRGNQVYVDSPETQILLLAQARQNCFNKLSNLSWPGENETVCLPTWDNVTCWTDASPGEVLSQPCPNYISRFVVTENVTRTCTENGTWRLHPVRKDAPWSNYSLCYPAVETPPSELYQKHIPVITLLANIGYGISLTSVVCAVVIMLSFRKLYCPRNKLHLNLFASFILRALMSFLRQNLFINGVGLEQDVQRSMGTVYFVDVEANEYSHWECKTVIFMFMYTLCANYVWILMEGLYLYTLIFTAVFSENSTIRWYMVFGWLSPLSFLIPWAIVRALYDNVYCWNISRREEFRWIIQGPLLAVILVNFVFFINIVRVLFTKLSASNTREGCRYRYIKLAKSTLVLIPLFGIHYLVMFYLHPEQGNDLADIIKLYFEMILNSLQGFLVALLYCFLNGEVQSEIKKKWHRLQLQYFPGRSHRGGDDFSCSRKADSNGLALVDSCTVSGLPRGSPLRRHHHDEDMSYTMESRTSPGTDRKERPVRTSSGARPRQFGDHHETGRLLLEGTDDCFVSESGITEIMCIESMAK